jgi:hypothetical protein
VQARIGNQNPDKPIYQVTPAFEPTTYWVTAGRETRRPITSASIEHHQSNVDEQAFERKVKSVQSEVYQDYLRKNSREILRNQELSRKEDRISREQLYASARQHVQNLQRHLQEAEPVTKPATGQETREQSKQTISWAQYQAQRKTQE